MKPLALSFLLVASISLFGDTTPSGTINCTAKALVSGRWDVSLNADSRDLEIKTGSGSVYKGTTNYLYSSSQRLHTYFLPLNYENAVAIRIDVRGGAREVAMCLNQNECYLCKE